MRLLVLVCALLAIVLSTYAILRDKPQHPVNISNGLTYVIPQRDAKHFYVTGLGAGASFDDFVHNRIIHPDIDYTEVYMGDNLISNSSIALCEPGIPCGSPVTVHIRGRVSPHSVRGWSKASWRR